MQISRLEEKQQILTLKTYRITNAVEGVAVIKETNKNHYVRYVSN
jgi:hypothetical protein